MQTPACRHQNPAGAGFCLTCGIKLSLVCSSCGADIQAGSNFCSSCGARVILPAASASGVFAPARQIPRHLAEKILTSKGVLEGERKQVTVLFADLKGSMELLVDRDPEEAQTLLDSVLGTMIDAVHRYEGTVNQVMGDGIMALFGAPLAHEDHAVRACYAALRMQQAIRSQAEDLRRSVGAEVRIRVGLHSGEVVVRAIRSDVHMDYSAVGLTTHLAARMEQLAPPGSTWVTDDTRRLVEGFIRVSPLGPIPIRGMADPVEVFELVGASPARTRFQVAAARGLSRFVGRQAELAQLDRLLSRAAAGHGQVVAVVGEPGLGKSRLLHEFIQSVDAREWLILETDAVAHGRDTGDTPVVDLVRAYCDLHPGHDIREIRERVHARLLTRDPALHATVPALLALLGVPMNTPSWEALDPAQRRRRILDAVRQLLLAESRIRPILIAVEDLQWIDSETQSLLDLLVEDLAGARLLVLVTYRPEHQSGWGGRPRYTELRLTSLSPASAEQLLEAILGPGLAPLKRLLMERTEANPFFVEESVRALVETAALAGSPGAYRLLRPLQGLQIPATVRAVVAGRIERLPPVEKHLLQCAAVIGRDVPYLLLQAVVEWPDDELRRQLGQLRTGEFLYESRIFPELEYTFKHSLTHEVAYDSVLHTRRQELHARIVGTLETLHADCVADHVERLAYHAVRGELWDRAVDWLRQAGSRAFARSAHPQAVQWFEEALRALERQPQTTERLAAGLDLRLELRYALIPLGRFTEVLERLREAERIARSLGDTQRLGRVLSFLVNYLQVTGDLERAVDSGQQALRLAEKHEDLATQVVTTAYLSSIYQTLGEYTLAVEHARRCIAAQGGDVVHQRFGKAVLPSVYARTSLARALAETGEFGDARRAAEEALSIAQDTGHTYSLAFATLGLGFVHLRQGDIYDAVATLERSTAFAEDAPALYSLAGGFLAAAYVDAEQPDRVATLIERAEAHATAVGLAGTALGHGVRLAATAERHLFEGDAVQADRYGRRALDFFARIKARGYQAWTLRLLGAVAACRGSDEVDDAARAYREALVAAESLGMAPLAARCRLGLAELRGRTEPDGGRADLIAVAKQFRALGMMSQWRSIQRNLGEGKAP